jgi:hypothetical protein
MKRWPASAADLIDGSLGEAGEAGVGVGGRPAEGVERCRGGGADFAECPGRTLSDRHGHIARDGRCQGAHRRCGLFSEPTEQRGGPVADVRVIVGDERGEGLQIGRGGRPQLFERGRGPLADFFGRVATCASQSDRGGLGIRAQARQLLGCPAPLDGIGMAQCGRQLRGVGRHGKDHYRA